jgi:hypothetical protein
VAQEILPDADNPVSKNNARPIAVSAAAVGRRSKELA